MLTRQEIIGKIEQNKDKIRAFGVRKLTLIGSYARNHAKNESDIDFLVEFKRGRGLYDDYANLLAILEDIFQKDVDLVKPAFIRKELKQSILGGIKIEAQI